MRREVQAGRATLARCVAQRLGWVRGGRRTNVYAEFFNHEAACFVGRVRLSLSYALPARDLYLDRLTEGLLSGT